MPKVSEVLYPDVNRTRKLLPAGLAASDRVRYSSFLVGGTCLILSPERARKSTYGNLKVFVGRAVIREIMSHPFTVSRYARKVIHGQPKDTNIS